jgi:endonuclease YncB( thermonuclease family)
MGCLYSALIRSPRLVAREGPASAAPELHAEEGEEVYCERLLREIGSVKRRFLPVPDHYIGLVNKVHDGDSLTISCEVGGKPCSLPVRIKGVDAPELCGKTSLEGEVGAAVRDAVSALCLGRFARLSECNRDKYGRLLARVEIVDRHSAGDPASPVYGPKDVSDFLLDNSLAYPYDGGTKRAFSETDLKVAAVRARLLSRRAFTLAA